MAEPAFQEQRERDQREMAAIRRHQVVTLKAMGFTLAIVIAPFLALIYSVNMALAVLAIALGFTTWLTWHTTRMVSTMFADRLRMAAVLNGALALVALVVLVMRLATP